MKSDSHTREALLDAATRLFAARGFDGASIREITREAEANLGAVTYHFGTKEALFEAALWRAVEPLAERIAQLETDTAPPLAKIEAATRTLFEFLAANADVPRLIVHVLGSDRPIPQAARTLLERNHRIIAGVIADGQRDGTMRQGDPRLLALGVPALPIWLVLMRRLLSAAVDIDHDDPGTRIALFETAVTLVKAGLAAHADATP